MRCIVLIQSGFTHLNHVFTMYYYNVCGVICVKSYDLNTIFCLYLLVKKKQQHLLQIIRLDLIQCPQHQDCNMQSKSIIKVTIECAVLAIIWRGLIILLMWKEKWVKNFWGNLNFLSKCDNSVFQIRLEYILSINHHLK